MASEPHLYQSDEPLHRNGRSDHASDRRYRQNLEDLNDIDYGAWQFKTFAEAKTQDATLFAAWFAKPQLVRFPKGESLQDLAARTANALLMVLARHRDEIVVLVGHDSVNRLGACH